MISIAFFLLLPRPPRPTLFPYTTLFRSIAHPGTNTDLIQPGPGGQLDEPGRRLATTLAQRVRRRQRACHNDRPGKRSEEHTSELQSHSDLVCRLLLEKKNKKKKNNNNPA